MKIMTKPYAKYPRIAKETAPATKGTDFESLDSTAFARNGYTSPFGKADVVVPAFRAPSDVVDAFARKAAAAGKSTAELLRYLMYVSVYGRDEVLKVHQLEIEKVVRTLGDVSKQ